MRKLNQFRHQIKLREGEKKDAMKSFERRTREEVAEIMGLTPERVRQIERIALNKIRFRLKELYDSIR